MIQIDNRIRPWCMRSLLYWNGFRKFDSYYINTDANLKIKFGCNFCDIRPLHSDVMRFESGSVYDLQDGGRYPMHGEVYTRLVGWFVTHQKFFKIVSLPNFQKGEVHTLLAFNPRKLVRKQLHHRQHTKNNLNRFARAHDVKINWGDTNWLLKFKKICDMLLPLKITLEWYSVVNGQRQGIMLTLPNGASFIAPTIGSKYEETEQL